MGFIKVTRIETSKTIVVNTRHIRAIIKDESGGADIVMPSAGAFAWSIHTEEPFQDVVDMVVEA